MIQDIEAVTRRCSVKKGVLRNFAKFTGKHLCQSLFFNKDAGLKQLFFKKKKRDHGTGVSCEFCEISKNTFSYRTPPLAASGDMFNLDFLEKGRRLVSTPHLAYDFSGKIFLMLCSIN